MKIEGNYTFDAPRDVVWEMFLDPEVLARTMPGCRKLELVGENEYEGVMQMRVGPVQGTFQGNVHLTDLQAPETYHMKVDGRGPAGFVRGEGDVRLEQTDEGTIMHYSGDAQVGGRLAQVGQRLLDSSARAITKQSLDNLAKQVDARQKKGDAEEGNGESAEDGSAAEDEAPAAPTQTEFAVGVAREMMNDLVPPEQRPELMRTGAAVVGILFVIMLIVNWWTSLLAGKIAKRLQEKEVL